MKNVSREKWLPCFQPELVSSEESGDEDGDEDGEFVVRPLVWRSESKHQRMRSIKNVFCSEK